jgi:FlaA1/EpsC-like NDP-sugar epimerase
MAFAHDMAAAAIAWLCAYWLRFNLSLSGEYLHSALVTLTWIVPLQALIFWRFGLYRGMWRFASLPDLKRILFAVGTAGMATPLVLLLFQIQVLVPRSVLLLDPLLLTVLMGGSRLAYRAWKEHRLHGLMAKQGEPVLVIGAGDAAVNLLKELSRSQVWRVEGLLDDNPAKHGRLLQGVKVLGPLAEVAEWSKQLNVKRAIIAMPSVSHKVRRMAVECCTAAGVEVLTVPSFDDLLGGKVTVSQVRKVELDDLLGREPVHLDDQGLHQLLTGKAVLITGAGGSIGAELCRQVAKFEPRCLILFELNEYALYRMEQEFAEHWPKLVVRSVIGDVKNRIRVEQVLREFEPTVVFHAAAYKHVPLMEIDNAWEAVRNNVLGTYVVASAARECGVEKFVLISTDKAVNPTNVMGASKRLAEMVCQSLQGQGGTQYIMVRFGNVLGSAGSVIPKFQDQIARGGPITVTHPEITRYFMSIPEAAQLVLQAALMGKGGEILVLDMGEPVKIVDLARDMIRLSGFAEDDIRIAFTGLRPGEKLYEELLADGEHTLPTPHPKLRIAQARAASNGFLQQAISWTTQEKSLAPQSVKAQLKEWVPEYHDGSA